MLQRGQSVSSPGLFAPSVHHNMKIMKEASLALFCSDIPAFNVMLEQLQNQGLFAGVHTAAYTLDEFLQRQYPLAAECFSFSPVCLVAHALPDLSREKAEWSLPGVCQPLAEKMEYYIRLILDVLDNRLAQRNYEAGLPDQENVSERVHALQAGKISLLMGMPQHEVLALLLHDIARPTMEDQHHGHVYHCEEGSVILAPLGLDTDYSWFHAFAKFLLNEFCPAYRALISPVSQLSLALQKDRFQRQLERLAALDARQLADFIHRIMFMRLIDDISKVPEAALETPAAYYDDGVIRGMLASQLQSHVSRPEMQSAQSLTEYADRLDKAISLLSRAKTFSNHPQLYLQAAAAQIGRNGR